MRLIIIVVSALLAFQAMAQEASVEVSAVTKSETEVLIDFEPPKTDSGKIFSKTAKRNWQHTDAKYLHGDQSLKASNNWWFNKNSENANNAASREKNKNTATLFLVLLAAALLLLVWYYSAGGKWFGWLKKSDRFAKTYSTSNNDGDALLEAAAGDGMSLNELAKINDPREGLHALLVQSLVRAAKQNNIALRRSLTTRDVLRRVPSSWGHRSVLQSLVSHAELVLFGGRAITSHDYANALQLAQPIFGKGRGR